MAWCRQATSHYLSQCWYRTKLPNLASLGHNELTHCDLVMLYAAVDLGSEYGRRLKSTPPIWELSFHCKSWPRFLVNISFKILHWWKCISKYCLQMVAILFRPSIYETTSMSTGMQDINIIRITAGIIILQRSFIFICTTSHSAIWQLLWVNHIRNSSMIGKRLYWAIHTKRPKTVL